MAIADRKERALREREKLILEHADAMLRESGYLGLNLDEVARRIEYSKATIYNHFKTKEDLVLAVAVAHIEIRTEFFGRALSFDGSSRERMFVIGGADTILSKLNPHWFPILQLVRSQSIWEKASEEQHERYTQATRACMAIPKEIIRQGRESGDIPLEALPDENILFGVVSMAKGAHLLEDGLGMFPEKFERDTCELLQENFHAFLDGVGWTPLRAEWDYTKTMERIRTELFPSEMDLLKAC